MSKTTLYSICVEQKKNTTKEEKEISTTSPSTTVLWKTLTELSQQSFPQSRTSYHYKIYPSLNEIFEGGRE